MRTSQATARPRKTRALLLPLLVIAVLLGAAVAPWAGGAPGAPTGPRIAAVADAEPRPRRELTPPAARPPRVEAPPSVPVPVVTPAAPHVRPAAAPEPRARATPELMARVAAEAGQSLDAVRAELVARCVPPDRAGELGGARFTFNVTFDASGREIARGIGEDRRFRAPEVASCLRRLPLGTLRVSAPGANVGVRLALKLP